MNRHDCDSRLFHMILSCITWPDLFLVLKHLQLSRVDLEGYFQQFETVKYLQRLLARASTNQLAIAFHYSVHSKPQYCKALA